MLTCAQLRYNFCFYRIAQKLCLSPLKLNVELGTFTYKRKCSYLAWKAQYFLASAYAIFIIFQLFQSILQKDKLNLIHVSVHAAVALMGLLTFRLGALFMLNKETHMILCNGLLLHVQKSKDGGGSKGNFTSFIRGKARSFCCLCLVSIRHVK